jgi:hypothetical protein
MFLSLAVPVRVQAAGSSRVLQREPAVHVRGETVVHVLNSHDFLLVGQFLERG